ncbi:hypothetical protein BDW71DRAFT_183895 [Aspergillus fruticulosus]
MTFLIRYSLSNPTPTSATSSHGRTLEWIAKSSETHPGDRNFSPLFGYYPGTELTPLAPSDLANAANNSSTAASLAVVAAPGGPGRGL